MVGPERVPATEHNTPSHDRKLGKDSISRVLDDRRRQRVFVGARAVGVDDLLAERHELVHGSVVALGTWC
jgi:hypothetical protein